MWKKVKGMRKAKKVVFFILFVLVIALCIVGIWQRNNISAVIKTISKTDVELAQELDNTKKELEEDLKEHVPVIVSDFTAEEEKKIMTGEMTVEEAVSKLNERYEETVKKNEGVTNPDNVLSGENKDKSKNKAAEKLISEKIVELYSLKAYYLGQLGQMEAAVKRDYIALPDSKKTLIGKTELVEKYMGVATSLLNQCDTKVAALLKELEKEIKAVGGDTSVIKTILASYENEKAVKKAYYLKLLNK